jgi:glucose/arabinose dehydrogenase
MLGGDIAISPDGQLVAAIGDGDVGVYRVSDGSQVKVLPYRNQMP